MARCDPLDPIRACAPSVQHFPARWDHSANFHSARIGSGHCADATNERVSVWGARRAAPLVHRGAASGSFFGGCRCGEWIRASFESAPDQIVRALSSVDSTSSNTPDSTSASSAHRLSSDVRNSRATSPHPSTHDVDAVSIDTISLRRTRSWCATSTFSHPLRFCSVTIVRTSSI